MGISALTARLTQYAIPLKIVKYSRKANIERTPYRLVIDGPALAHHIYYSCRSARKRRCRTAFAAYPTYGEVSRAILSWLDCIETIGVMVHGIFFDGYLPSNKKEERRQRLNKLLKELRSYRSSHTQPQGATLPRQISDADLTSPDSTTPEKGYNRLPALTFLVSTVIETLRASRYANRTSVVPGEADAYCAQNTLMADHMLVVTGDSDLLVHCNRGSVTFLDDIELSNSMFKTRVYKPTHITEALQCDDFRSIAYHMATDTHRTANLAAELVHTHPVRARDLADAWFGKALSLNPDEQQYLLTNPNPLLNTVLAKADPRTSELLCAWTILLQRHRNQDEGAELRMSLPFLIDDATRASAWKTSAHIRTIAYSLLQIQGRPLTILEMDRRGEEIRDCHIELLEPDAVLEADRQLIQELFSAAETGRTRSSWKKAVVIHLLRRLHTASEIIPGHDQLLALLPDVITGDEGLRKSMPLTWEAVHFKAQVEGVMYSLHMLKTVQTIRFKLDDQAHTLQSAIRPSSKAMLEDLPELRGMMTSPNEKLAEGEEAKLIRECISEFFDELAAEDKSPSQHSKAQKGQGKRKRDTSKDSKIHSPKEQLSLRPNNIYTFLNES